jgi:hypothetical protein
MHLHLMEAGDKSMAKLAVLDARNARQGGGRTFVESLRQPLSAALRSYGAELVVLDGPAASRREQLDRQITMTRADAILHAGNRGSFAPRSRHVVCVRNRLLLPGVEAYWPDPVGLRPRQAALLAALSTSATAVVPSDSMRGPLERLAGILPMALRPSVAVVRHGRPPWAAPMARKFGERIEMLYPSFAGLHKNFRFLSDVVWSLPTTIRQRLKLILTVEGTEVVHRSSLTYSSAPSIADWFAGLEDTVIFAGPIRHAELEAYYANSDILLFPSLIESFGNPLVEAMTMNMPIISSKRDWAHEVCGDAARYADPADPQEWAAEIIDVVGRNERSNAAGLLRSQQFDWASAGEEYTALLFGEKISTPT